MTKRPKSRAGTPRAPGRNAPVARGPALDESLFELLAKQHLPLSAYQIAQWLDERGEHIAVMSIYRSLERLCADQRVEKVETTSGYRVKDMAKSILTICAVCGEVKSLAADECHDTLERTIASTGFKIDRIAIEVPGLCRSCGLANQN